ncbi:AAA family ATPase [Streptomyces jumonjinensis]|uniref:AAA family ATPase n=1 Tax=Streptomyces jumonjinensis TaxID=1945 RepID=UPI0037B674E4
MLTAFRTAAAGRRGRPVLVLGEEVVLANPAAVELLDPVDHIRLRTLATGLRGERRRSEATVELSSGRTVAVRFRAVEAGAGGVLFEFDETGPPGARTAPRHGSGSGSGSDVCSGAASTSTSGVRRAPASPVYIGGAPGTGRTTAARSLAGDAGVRTIVLDGVRAAGDGAAEWQAALGSAAAGAPALLLVEDVQLLPEGCAVRLLRLLAEPVADSGPSIVLTGPPLAELSGYPAIRLSGYPAVLAARCRAAPAARPRRGTPGPGADHAHRSGRRRPAAVQPGRPRLAGRSPLAR